MRLQNVLHNRNKHELLIFTEDELEIERDFQVMEKAYTEVAGRVLGRPRKRKKP